MSKFFHLFIFSLVIVSCRNDQQDQILKGNLLLYSDEAFIPLVNAEKDVFCHFYKEAHVKIIPASEDSAVYKFLNGEAGMIVVSADLTKTERAFLAKQNIVPEVYPIAFDAVAFIVSKERKDTALTQRQLEEIFSGRIRNWKELSSKEASISIVGNRKGSADMNYILEIFSPDTSVSIYAIGSEEKVITYVASHPSAIGITGLLSLRKKSIVQSGIKVIGVREDDGTVRYPFQSDLASGAYPYKREILLIARYKTGLGTGLASYVLTEEGQRVVLKSGLLPVQMPGREVILKKEF